MRWFAAVLMLASQGWAADGGLFHEPSAVCVDPATDVVFVSNVNGGPFAKDNNGYVSEFFSDGGVLAAKWVAGGDPQVTLHAPTGVAVVDGRVYVADLDTVRVFDRKTRAPLGEVKVLGGSSVQGLVALGSRLYLVDSGLRLALDGGVEATGTDGLYAIETRGSKPVLKTLVKSRSLRHPRALALTASTIWVASQDVPTLFAFDLAGHPKGEPVLLPCIASGGLVIIENDVWLGSSQGVLHGRLGRDEWQSVSGDLGTPGLMSLDAFGARLWVPSTSRNALIEVPWAPEPR
jgi:hypothetical protein